MRTDSLSGSTDYDRIVQELHTQAHGFAQALQVPGIVQIPVLHGRWYGLVSGGEPQFASTDGQV